jgi:hypothetical protein
MFVLTITSYKFSPSELFASTIPFKASYTINKFKNVNIRPNDQFPFNIEIKRLDSGNTFSSPVHIVLLKNETRDFIHKKYESKLYSNFITITSYKKETQKTTKSMGIYISNVKSPNDFLGEIMQVLSDNKWIAGLIRNYYSMGTWPKFNKSPSHNVFVENKQKFEKTIRHVQNVQSMFENDMKAIGEQDTGVCGAALIEVLPANLKATIVDSTRYKPLHYDEDFDDDCLVLPKKSLLHFNKFIKERKDDGSLKYLTMADYYGLIIEPGLPLELYTGIAHSTFVISNLNLINYPEFALLGIADKERRFYIINWFCQAVIDAYYSDRKKGNSIRFFNSFTSPICLPDVFEFNYIVLYDDAQLINAIKNTKKSDNVVPKDYKKRDDLMNQLCIIENLLSLNIQICAQGKMEVSFSQDSKPVEIEVRGSSMSGPQKYDRHEFAQDLIANLMEKNINNF